MPDSMIAFLEIKNFKPIKKKAFALRNLNLLLGLNGMGKSSFIQSLLLLKQSDKLKYGELKLNGSYVNIGNTKDALYQYSKNEDLSFTIKFDEIDPFKLDFNYIQESDSFTLKKNEELLPQFFDYSLFSQNFQYLNALRLEPTSIHIKSYGNVVNQKNIGDFGQYTAHFIEVNANEDIVFENLLHKDSIIKDSVTGKEFLNKTLIHQINSWMGEISPGVNIRTTAIPNTENLLLEFVYKQPNFGNTNRYKPTNVGFGISYALPVVTALLASRPGELIIIENPESHIHPRGQAELGKLIALTAMNNVQIIIETHSDHILNGVRVAVKSASLAKDKVVGFYFDKIISESEQYAKVTDIFIDSNGELSEYPINMLDEWSNQMVKLV